jgi:hypothetical protein
MNAARTWLLATALVSLATLSGCVDERAFLITQNTSPCVTQQTTAGGGVTALLSGVLDISSRGTRQGYFFSPTVVNAMLPSEDVDGEPERNRLRLKRFDVELNLGELGKRNNIPSQLTSFSTLVSAVIEPAGTAEIQNVKILPDAMLPFITTLPPGGRDLIVATIQAVADHNGSELKSIEFEYPIEICDGCLVFPLGKDDGFCPTEKPYGVSLPFNECGLAQDQPTTCCLQKSGGLTFGRCFTETDLDALPTADPPADPSP